MNDLIVAAAVMFSSTQMGGSGFCEHNPLVPFNELIHDVEKIKGKRFQTRVLLRTDGKEYTLVKQYENDRVGALLESDAVSEAYTRKHNLRSESRYDLLNDFWGKLRVERGRDARMDMSRISDYRQERLLCGRLYRNLDGYKFVVDDSIIEKSYLLPRSRPLSR